MGLTMTSSSKSGWELDMAADPGEFSGSGGARPARLVAPANASASYLHIAGRHAIRFVSKWLSSALVPFALNHRETPNTRANRLFLSVSLGEARRSAIQSRAVTPALSSVMGQLRSGRVKNHRDHRDHREEAALLGSVCSVSSVVDFKLTQHPVVETVGDRGTKCYST